MEYINKGNILKAAIREVVVNRNYLHINIFLQSYLQDEQELFEILIEAINRRFVDDNCCFCRNSISDVSIKALTSAIIENLAFACSYYYRAYIDNANNINSQIGHKVFQLLIILQETAYILI